MAKESKTTRPPSAAQLKLRAAVVEQTLLAERFSGPIPDPETLAKYEQAHPGLANRIMLMAENESARRHNLEKLVIEADIADRIRMRGIERVGQWFAFILSLVIIVGGMILIGHGYSLAGTFLTGTTLIALATLFIYGRSRNQEEANPSSSADSPATASAELLDE